MSLIGETGPSRRLTSYRLCSSKRCGSCFSVVVSMLTIPFSGPSPFLHLVTHISVRLLGLYYKCSWLLRTPSSNFLFYTLLLNASLQDRAVGHQGREIWGEWKGGMLSPVFRNNHRVLLAPAKTLVGGWDSELAMFKVLHAYILVAFVFCFDLGCVSLVHFHGCFLFMGKPDLLEFSALLPRVRLALDAQFLRCHCINSLHSSDHPVLPSQILVLNLLSFEQLLLQLLQVVASWSFRLEYPWMHRENASTTRRRQKMLSKSLSNLKAWIFML